MKKKMAAVWALAAMLTMGTATMTALAEGGPSQEAIGFIMIPMGIRFIIHGKRAEITSGAI